MKKKIWIFALVGALVLAAAFVGLYFGFRDRAQEGSKVITLTVTGENQQSRSYELHTDAEYLQQAMDEAEDLHYVLDESGMLVELNGESARWDTDGAYWAIYVNGAYATHGIDTQPLTHADSYEFIYTPA